MTRQLLLALISLVLASCVTPYQAWNPLGGYSDYELGEGIYQLTFSGADWDTESTRERVLNFWHRRAGEICGGSDRYEVLDFFMHEEPEVPGIPTWLVCHFSARGSIRCKEDRTAQDDEVRRQLVLEMERTRAEAKRGADKLRKELEIRTLKDDAAVLGADYDGDNVSDAEDNCPFVANSDQSVAAQFPTVGCACLCGDPNRDCRVDDADATEAQHAGITPPLAPVSNRFNLEFCDVNSDGRCNVADATEMQRAGMVRPLPPISPSFDVTGCSGYLGQ